MVEQSKNDSLIFKYMFRFIDKDVGDIEYISLTANRKDYNIKTIKVKKITQWKIAKKDYTNEKDKTCMFPIFTWITANSSQPVFINTNKTCLPQKEIGKRKAIRGLHGSKSIEWDNSTAGQGRLFLLLYNKNI